MAEHIVSFAVERLGDLLIREIVFSCGVKGQVKRLQTELRWMGSFLKDADAKQEGNDLVRQWVEDIRDVAYDADDVVDKFILKVASPRRGDVRSVSYACFLYKCINLREVGMEIQAIQERIHDISGRRQRYGLVEYTGGEGTSSARNERLQQLRRSYPHVEEEDIIGLEEDTESLVAELIKEEERLRTVCIVGMGGVGKTTLAKKIYNHQIIKCHFDCCAWTFISQQGRTTRDILQDILRRVYTPTEEERKEIGTMDEQDLVEKLHNILKEKKYLVVLDDIWSNDAWDGLKPAFPNGKMGCKLMLTTRNKDVARHVDTMGFLHEPRLLQEEQSWELFCKKAFHGNDSSSCPPNLERLGRDMVRKCGGLPLAVVVLGGLLAAKELNEWEMVHAHIGLDLSKEGRLGVEEILALSYNDLPHGLKSCFLYLGLFPEDSRIPTKKLIRLWVAEGFIQAGQRGETMEDIGEQYLLELHNRCMVLTGKRGVSGRLKAIRLHDLMRDLCISEGKKQNFLEILPSDSGNNKLRRAAIHSSEVANYSSLCHSFPLLRTLLIFNPNGYIEDLSVKFLYQDLKLLRVLDISSTTTRSKHFWISLPKKIGKLIHLRYLSVQSGDVDRENLEKSIGNLQSLQTLDLTGALFNKLANLIWKMKQLRHLYIKNPLPSVDRDFRVDTLINLQTLRYMTAGSWIEGGLGNLTNLRKMGLIHVSRSHMEHAFKSIFRSKCPLRSLHLRFATDENESSPDLEQLSDCPHLRKLHMEGRIEKNGQVQMHWPPNLTKLTLIDSELQQDPMTALQNLKALIFLELGLISYRGKKMVCCARGFPQLQTLRLRGLKELEEWIVEEGAMPCLKHLTIEGCRKLRRPPEGLRFRTTLRELQIIAMPIAFQLQVRDEEGFRHIPSITFSRLRVVVPVAIALSGGNNDDNLSSNSSGGMDG